MNAPRVQLHDADGIATVSLNRPEKHNGLDLPLIEALVATARSLRRRRDVRAVILRGEGPSFCSGIDVSTVFSNRRRFLSRFFTFGRRQNLFQEVSLGWRALQVPVIAAIHGNCFGGGLQIALGADFRIAAPDARLSVMEVKWGLVPDMGGSVLLRELLPLDQAKLLTLSGRIISGEEALRLGLVTEVASDPMERAQALAAQLAARSPDAVAAGKQLLQRNACAGLRAALARERRYQLRMFASRNQRIAVKANQQREQAVFQDREFDD